MSKNLNIKLSKGLISIVFCLISFSALACDACGCASGGNFVGLLPQFNKKFVGFRYRNSVFKVDPSKLEGLHNHADQFEHKDSYTTTELWARFYPTKRIQVMAFVPFNINTKSENGVTEKISGIGDMSAIVSATVFNNTDSLHLNFRHALLAGVGVKLPTGKYQQRDADKVLYSPGFQTGTGAYSFLINAIYTARLGRFGFNTNASYAKNGTAESDYRFGNSFNFSSTFFYWLRGKDFSILPNVGVFHESLGADTQYKQQVVLTGGNHTYGTLGSEFYYKRYTLGTSYHLPLSSQNPSSSPISSSRVFATVSVVF